MGDGTVYVEGLRELNRLFGRVEHGALRRELQAELRPLARLVRERARQLGESKGLRGDPATDRGEGHPGLLLRKITYSVRGLQASVRATARRPSQRYPNGFNYPLVAEYGGRHAERVGPRAFMHPALEMSTQEVETAIGRLLDRILEGQGDTLL